MFQVEINAPSSPRPDGYVAMAALIARLTASWFLLAKLRPTDGGIPNWIQWVFFSDPLLLHEDAYFAVALFSGLQVLAKYRHQYDDQPQGTVLKFDSHHLA